MKLYPTDGNAGTRDENASCPPSHLLVMLCGFLSVLDGIGNTQQGAARSCSHPCSRLFRGQDRNTLIGPLSLTFPRPLICFDMTRQRLEFRYKISNSLEHFRVRDVPTQHTEMLCPFA
jgi:hypothetical protein